jgi:hypothetical protein
MAALSNMEKKLVAKVRFELFSGDVSGKSQGYLSGVRPNHYVNQLGHTVIGAISFESGRINLGETQDAIVSYHYYEPFAQLLVPGLTYEVREGSRTVGAVEVLEVLENG